MPLKVKTPYEEKIEELTVAINGKAKELGQVEVKLADLTKAEIAKQAKLQKYDLDIIERERELKAVTDQIKESASVVATRVTGKKNQIRDLDRQVADMEERVRRLAREIAEAQDRKTELNALSTAIAALKADRDALKAEYDSMSAEYKKRAVECAALEEKVTAANKSLVGVMKQVEVRLVDYDEKIKMLRFYARRLKKYFVAYKLPFPKDLEDDLGPLKVPGDAN